MNNHITKLSHLRRFMIEKAVVKKQWELFEEFYGSENKSR